MVQMFVPEPLQNDDLEMEMFQRHTTDANMFYRHMGAVVLTHLAIVCL